MPVSVFGGMNADWWFWWHVRASWCNKPAGLYQKEGLDRHIQRLWWQFVTVPPGRLLAVYKNSLKGILHPKMDILSWFTHPHAMPVAYQTFYSWTQVNNCILKCSHFIFSYGTQRVVACIVTKYHITCHKIQEQMGFKVIKYITFVLVSISLNNQICVLPSHTHFI